ncbi:MAG: hypothetical protein ACXV1K_10185 [Kineosporiaceae bacterium]
MSRGVLFTRGQQMLFPAGSLTIRLGDDGVPAMDVATRHLRADHWSHWAREAVDATVAALAARAAVAEETAAVDAAEDAAAAGGPPADYTRFNELLDVELRASMRAVSASAFAVDSFYASVAARSPKHPDHDKWHTPRPDGRRASRVKQVFGTLHYHLKIRPQAAKNFRPQVAELFRFRGWAVHADATFKEAVHREDLDRAVDWHYAAFRTENAVGALVNTLSMLYSLVLVLDRGSDELREWKPFALESMEDVMAHYEAQDQEGLPPFVRPGDEPVPEAERG